MEKTLRSALLQSSAEPFLSSAKLLPFRSSKSILKSLIHSIQPSDDISSSLPVALHSSISHSIASLHYHHDHSSSPQHSPISPPTKRVRRSARNKASSTVDDFDGADGGTDSQQHRSKEKLVVEELRILAHITLLCVTHLQSVFKVEDLFPAVKILHDNLMLFESDSVMLGEISMICEEWWKRDLLEKESLISLFLPVLLSKSLTENKKVDVHRVYALREAFELFDFEDESIEDLKLLLMRAVITPVYWKSEEGKKFIAFMFGLNLQLMKDAFAIIKAQIPFGKKSMLDACGEILFRAWKVANEDKLEEIENGFLLSLIESAIHASSVSLSASIRRILGGFINQRTSEGVEKLLYKLAEPIIFRSLQVANSNVRLNALHLFLDLFPLEDPDSTKDVKDMLLNKQFFLMEKLLKDDCPDIRVVAVEGSCRILHLFWEIIPSPAITKLIIIILDDLSHDVSKEVRLSSVNGLIFLLGNPQTHELLKVLLSRIKHLLFDPVLSVREAFVDLLLSRDIHSFQFNKVVDFDKLLVALSTDQPIIAQKLTRLLIPSYFPSRVSTEEACARCVTLMRRAPEAGVRFCEYIIEESASGRPLLLQLASTFIDVVLSPKQHDTVQAECLIVGAAYLCNHLISEGSYKDSLKTVFSNVKLKKLVAVLSTGRAKAALFGIVSAISSDAAADIVQQSIRSITKCSGLSEDTERQAEAKSVHKFLLHCGKFDELLDVVATILKRATISFAAKFGPNLSKRDKLTNTRKKLKSSENESAKNSICGNELSIASGLAWQIREMLVPEDIRTSVLESSNLKVIFSALKDISEALFMHYSGGGYVESLPLQAYTALAIHMTLHGAHINDRDKIDLVGTRIGSGFQKTVSQTPLDQTVDHVICLSEKLLQVLENGDCDGLPSSNLDNASNMQHSGLQHIQDVSRSPNHPGLVQTDEIKSVNIMNIFTAVLKFLSDVMSMQLYSCDPMRCLHTAIGYTQYMRKCVEVPLQHKEDNTNATLMYMKSSSTYVMKILNQVLIDMREGLSTQASASLLVNEFLDLIVLVELNSGSTCASQLVTAVKPWVPDLVLTLTYGNLSIDGDQHIYIWLSTIAELELNHVDEGSTEAQTAEFSKTCKFSVFKKIIALILESIHGHSDLLDGFGANFLSRVLVAFEKRDFRMALGLLHFVCTKLAGQHESIWGELKLMLPAMVSIYIKIDRELQDFEMNGDEMQRLRLAKALVKPVWNYHTYEMETDNARTEKPMED